MAYVAAYLEQFEAAAPISQIRERWVKHWTTSRRAVAIVWFREEMTRLIIDRQSTRIDRPRKL